MLLLVVEGFKLAETWFYNTPNDILKFWYKLVDGFEILGQSITNFNFYTVL